MDRPGAYALMMNGSDFTITNAITQLGDPLAIGLSGMASMSVQLDFRANPGGGTAVRAFIQTSLDSGATWIDIACALFTAGERRVLGFSTQSPPAAFVATDGTLADNTVVNGILGDRVRLKVVSTGTWTNTGLGARVVVR